MGVGAERVAGVDERRSLSECVREFSAKSCLALLAAMYTGGYHALRLDPLESTPESQSFFLLPLPTLKITFQPSQEHPSVDDRTKTTRSAQVTALALT